MGIEVTSARSFALRGTDERVVLDEAGPRTEGARRSFFPSKAETAANKAQFEKFREVLRADPNYRNFDGVADKAFAAIAKRAGAGGPLTGRVMAQAYSEGDRLLAQLKQARAQGRDAFVEQVTSTVVDGRLFEAAVAEATGGQIRDLAREVPEKVLSHLKADVLGEVRAEATAKSATTQLGRSRFADVFEAVKAAVVKRLDTVRAAVAATRGGPPVESLAGERLRPTVQIIQRYSDARLQARLRGSSGGDPVYEQRVMKHMGAQLARLDNRALLGHTKALMSADMVEFRIALANRQDDPRAQSLLEDLNSWESMVMAEVADRSLKPERSDGGFVLVEPLPGPQLGLLAKAEHQARDRELVVQSDAYLRGDPGATRGDDPAAVAKLQGRGITVDQLTEAIRSADLTINVPAELFKPGGPFLDDKGGVRPDRLGLKNVFELADDVKGKGYVERRKAIEHAEFPGLAELDQRGLDPRNHPISAAPNVGRLVSGAAAARGYGDVVLVLDPKVKERATFVPHDAFEAHRATFTEDKIVAYKGRLMDLMQPGSGLSEAGRKALAEDPRVGVELFQRLNGLKDRVVGPPDNGTFETFFDDELLSGLPGVSNDDRDVLYNAAIETFVDRGRDASQMTSLDRLSHLVKNLQEGQIDDIAKAAADPRRINLGGRDYIEAQVFGGVSLAGDVAEIRVLERDPSSLSRSQRAEQEATLAGARALAHALQIPFKTFSQTDKLATRRDTDETSGPMPALQGQAAQGAVRNLREFKERELVGVLDRYRAHEDGFDPSGIHGRRHISRALIYSNVLANIMREKGAQIDGNALYAATALHDAGRQGNGRDIWEGDSGQLALEHLQARGVDDEDYLLKTKAMIDNSGGPERSTLEGGILKSADSLDIIRERGLDRYDPDKLWFMHHDMAIGQELYLDRDDGLRSKLIQEAARLIEATEFRPPEEVRYRELRQQAEALNFEIDKLRAQQPVDQRAVNQLKRRQEDLLMEASPLLHAATELHERWNATTDSATVFTRIEAELLNHPDRYPTLHAYYDPER